MIQTAVAPALPRRRIAIATHPLVMRYLYPTLTFLALLALWELAISAFHLPDYVIPPPSHVPVTPFVVDVVGMTVCLCPVRAGAALGVGGVTVAIIREKLSRLVHAPARISP